MFRGLIKDIKSAAASFVGQYLMRASVAVPFVVAFGFATAAAALELTARYGAKNAFWLMAAGFSAIGVLAALVVTQREREAEAAEAAEEQQAAESGLGELGDLASEAATQAAGRLPLGLLAPLLANPSVPAMAAARFFVRNLPLVLLLGFVVLLFWPTEESEPGESAADTPETPPAAAPEAEAPWREAA